MPKQSIARILSRFLPLLAWMIFISVASSNSFSANNTSRIIGPLVLWLFPNTTPDQLTIIHAITRKLAHLTEYAILALLAARAFWTSPNQVLKTRWFLISLGVVIVYALIDEYHQSFVPSRTASLADSFIDMVGGTSALLVLRMRRRRS